MSNSQGILDSSLFARVGETVTLRDEADNQVAIFTFIKTRTGGRRNGDDVARMARKCAAAPELYEALEYALPYLRACVTSPRNGINQDGSIDVNCVDRAIAALTKARGE